MPLTTAAVLAGAALIGLIVLALASLRAWHGWLDLKRAELAQGHDHPTALGMIDLSDLKERLRKLEAIAAGVDL